MPCPGPPRPSRGCRGHATGGEEQALGEEIDHAGADRGPFDHVDRGRPGRADRGRSRCRSSPLPATGGHSRRVDAVGGVGRGAAAVRHRGGRHAAEPVRWPPSTTSLRIHQYCRRSRRCDRGSDVRRAAGSGTAARPGGGGACGWRRPRPSRRPPSQSWSAACCCSGAGTEPPGHRRPHRSFPGSSSRPVRHRHRRHCRSTPSIRIATPTIRIVMPKPRPRRAGSRRHHGPQRWGPPEAAVEPALAEPAALPEMPVGGHRAHRVEDRPLEPVAAEPVMAETSSSSRRRPPSTWAGGGRRCRGRAGRGVPQVNGRSSRPNDRLASEPHPPRCHPQWRARRFAPADEDDEFDPDHRGGSSARRPRAARGRGRALGGLRIEHAVARMRFRCSLPCTPSRRRPHGRDPRHGDLSHELGRC